MTASRMPKRLGNSLVERGVISLEQLQQALDYQRANAKGKLLGEVLVELGLCSDDHITEGLAAEFGIPFAKLEPRLADPKIVGVLPREFIEKFLVFPLFQFQGRLVLAVTDPANLYINDEVARMTGMLVQVVATTVKDVRRMLATLPDAKAFVLDDLIDENGQGDIKLIEQTIDNIGDSADAGHSPVIRLVNYLIYNGVKEGASDIHIEPAERCVRVRCRIDGVLHKAMEIPIHLINAVTSRIKIMANLDISERRLPQDGRVHVMLDSRRIDLRVSTFPGSRGEKTVIRILDTKSVSLNLRDLGFAGDILSGFQRCIQAPNGINLVTGPTGSGKTTTLYAALADIASMEVNVCTVEDPIEYNLPLINQFQVQEKIGLTFSKVLRTLLRQDPDVIMLGEIRDEETARTAIQAALTGHLVFSTLHTNDAPSAVTRLINMGVEPYLIGAALNVVLAQRLVRRICPKCRQPFTPAKNIRRTLQRMGVNHETFSRGAGCKRCRNTGYSGRLGIHELFPINDEIRDAIVSAVASPQLRKMGEQQGMITLFTDGMRKVREGMTTVDEMMQIATELLGASALAEGETAEPAASATS